MARFEKGGPNPGTGRPPGALNKTTRAVKDALMRALEAEDEDGGEAFFAGLRESDPKTFATLVSKLIPTESKISGDGDLPLLILRDYTGGASGGA